jgi:hypothetical protein
MGREGAGWHEREGIREGISDRESWKGGGSMLTYERPTLTLAGSFKKVTGLGGHGPKDMLVKHQLL